MLIAFVIICDTAVANGTTIIVAKISGYIKYMMKASPIAVRELKRLHANRLAILDFKKVIKSELCNKTDTG